MKYIIYLLGRNFNTLNASLFLIFIMVIAIIMIFLSLQSFYAEVYSGSYTLPTLWA